MHPILSAVPPCEAEPDVQLADVRDHLLNALVELNNLVFAAISGARIGKSQLAGVALGVRQAGDDLTTLWDNAGAA